MSDWRSRIEPTIQLTSPSDDLFEGYWRGGTRTVEKKLGIFEYPRVKGAYVQDLDVGGVRYPITFFFEGPNHDKKAKKFFKACAERGTWTIYHPVWMFLNLQLMSVTETTSPVDSANITEFTTEWIEPLTDKQFQNISKVDVQQAIIKAKENATNTFIDNVAGSTLADIIAAVRKAIAKIVAIVKLAKAIVSGIMSAVSAIRNTILGVISSTVMGIASCASFVHDIISLPGAIIKDLDARFSYFETIIGGSKSLNPKKPNREGIIDASIHEVVVTAAIAGMVQSVIDAEFTTRDEALAYAERLQQAYFVAMENLDAAQTMYAGQPIDRRYINRTDLAQLIRMMTALLLRESFDLATARRIRLTTDRAPIEIAITEDIDLDKFIRANRLQGDEVLLLRAGREVVVYQ